MSSPEDETLLRQIKEAIEEHQQADSDHRRRMVELVRRARARGWSWAEVGKALGVSRQAAFDRFARAVEEGGGSP